MNTIEEIKKSIMDKAQKEIETAEKECTIREMLTIQPNYVHVYPLYKSSGSITYEVKTKNEALNIVKTFDIKPSNLCKCNSGTSVKCFDDESSKEVTEYYAGLHIDKYHASIEFFIVINNEHWKIASLTRHSAKAV